MNGIFRRLAVVSAASAMVAAAVCLLAGPPAAQAYPEPSIVPRSWDLAFTHSAPRPIAVRDAAGDYQWYWYMTYKVVNNTNEDQLFVPEVEIATDEGDLFRSGQGVPTAVFFAIKEKERNSLLESPNQIVGKLLQGKDYARESVAVWPATKHDINQLSIFVAGLSGEVQTIPNPQTGEPVNVRKVLMIDYAMPGDGTSYSPELQAVVSQGQEWIMR